VTGKNSADPRRLLERKRTSSPSDTATKNRFISTTPRASWEGVIETNLPLSRFDDWLVLPAGFQPPRLPWKEAGSATAATPQELAGTFITAIKNRQLKFFFALLPTFEEFSAGALQAYRANLPEKLNDEQMIELKTLEGRLRQQHWTYCVAGFGSLPCLPRCLCGLLGDSSPCK
jgi:hypothetical protein